MLLLAPSVRAEVNLEQLDGKVRVEIDGELFTEYIYQGYAKPILYPIIGPHGIGMTRNYPMKQDVAGEAIDHIHQKSMWFTHGDVNGVSFWDEMEGAGKIVHDALIQVKEDPDRATIQTANKWVDVNGKEICSDTSTLVFSVPSGQRAIDWIITIQASRGDLTFGDTKEGTMGIRMHPNLRLSNDPKHGVTTANGQAINSAGDRSQKVWGKRAKWVDYWGQIDGKTVGIAIMDHPKNPRHPTWWHARDYGLVAANPFGIHDFEGKPPGTGELTVPAGESITFCYRLYFHEGDAQQARIAQQYEDFGQTAPAADFSLQPNSEVQP